MWKGHCGRRVLSLLLSLFNCEQFHSLRTYRTSELDPELTIRILRKTVCWAMLDKSKSSVQDKIDAKPNKCMCSPQNWTSVFINRNSVRIPSLFTHIELKVPSGSILNSRADPLFKSSTSNSSVRQQFRTELNECLSVEPLPRTIARYTLVAWPVAFSVFLTWEA